MELGIVKRNGHYATPQAGGGPTARGLLAVAAAGDNLLVAKCEPGLASAVAVEIDRAHIDEITGTLAGEDTIFVAVPNAKARRAAAKKIGTFGKGSQESEVRSQMNKRRMVLF